MNKTEFVEGGFLQEVNRQFFHPLGLAMGVNVNTEEDESFTVWMIDNRDDPEGMIFGDVPDQKKVDNVRKLYLSKTLPRINKLGYVIQPADDK